MSKVKAASTAWESLFRAQVSIMRRLEADDVMPDLTLKEYDVLFALRTAGGRPLRLKELNEFVLMHQSAFSRLVERLEARGLVSRSQAPDDGRGTVISLTQEGERMQKEMGRKHVAQIAHYVGGALDPEELAVLESLTKKLREAQHDIGPFALGKK